MTWGSNQEVAGSTTETVELKAVMRCRSLPCLRSIQTVRPCSCERSLGLATSERSERGAGEWRVGELGVEERGRS